MIRYARILYEYMICSCNISIFIFTIYSQYTHIYIIHTFVLPSGKMHTLYHALVSQSFIQEHHVLLPGSVTRTTGRGEHRRVRVVGDFFESQNWHRVTDGRSAWEIDYHPALPCLLMLCLICQRVEPPAIQRLWRLSDSMLVRQSIRMLKWKSPGA